MENTIKNMELIKNMDLAVCKMEQEFENSHYNAVKTLANSYINLLRQLEKNLDFLMEKVPSKRELANQKESLESLYDKANKEVHNVMGNGEYKNADNLTVIAERLQKSVERVSWILLAEERYENEKKRYANLPQNRKTTPTEKKEFSVSQVIQDLLNLSIKSGTLVAFYNEDHRGKGITTSLIKKAHELDAVLLVGLKRQAQLVKDMAKEMGLDVYVVSCREAELAQYSRKMKEDGYLIDETVDKELLKRFKSYKLLGGFSRIII